jgi:hypothetical protein
VRKNQGENLTLRRPGYLAERLRKDSHSEASSRLEYLSSRERDIVLHISEASMKAHLTVILSSSFQTACN